MKKEKCSVCDKEVDERDMFTWKSFGFKQKVCSDCAYRQEELNREAQAESVAY